LGRRPAPVRHGDDEWNDIVRWVVYALFEAGANVDGDRQNRFGLGLIG